MRNPAPINHFPPTLFSPNRSPIYGEAHLFSQPVSRLGTGNASVSWGRHSRGPALALDSIGRLRGMRVGNIVPAQDEEFQAVAEAFLRAVGEGGRAGIARPLAHSQHRERALRRCHCRNGAYSARDRIRSRTRPSSGGLTPGQVKHSITL